MTVRPIIRACTLAVLGALCQVPIAAPVHAEGYLQPFIDGRNNLHRNIAGNDLDAFVTTLRESGRIVIDIEVENSPNCPMHVSRCFVYHLVSAPNPDNRAWDLIGAVPRDDYGTRWTTNRDRNYRPTDIEMVQKHVVNPGGHGGDIRMYYSGLWVENRENLTWASFTQVEHSQFNKEFRKRVTNGSMVLVDLERHGDEVAAIFVLPRAEHRNSRWQPSQEEYQRDAPRIFSPGGGWPMYIRPGSSFDMSLRQDGVRDARVFTALNDKQLNNRLAQARKDGFQLVDIERNGDKWLAVFLRRSAEK